MIPRSCASIVLASAIWLLVGAMPNPDAAFGDSLGEHAGPRWLADAGVAAVAARLAATPRWARRRGALRLRHAPAARPGGQRRDDRALGQIIQTSDGAVDVESLSGRLEPLSLQGVRPLRSAEVTLIAREQEVVDQLLADGSPSDDRLLRDFTSSWMGRLSVVAAAIAPSHPAFMRWLACR